MSIHKEGTNILFIQFVLFAIIWVIVDQYSNDRIGEIIRIITFIIFIATGLFFRIPKREFARKDNIIYAPCDGKIVVIEETSEVEFYKDKRIQISIFMSPFNIHNNLYPTYGEITYTKYHPGKFLVAWNPKASNDNERNTIVIENNKISIMIRQIAGAIARRIVSYNKVGDIVSTADEAGFIKFGSRVDIFLPIGIKVHAKLNQKVEGGVNIIATY